LDNLWHILVLAVLPPIVALLLALPRTKRAALWVVGSAFAWSLFVEVIQGVLPYRNFELTDLLANTIGSLMAVPLLALLWKLPPRFCLK